MDSDNGDDVTNCSSLSEDKRLFLKNGSKDLVVAECKSECSREAQSCSGLTKVSSSALNKNLAVKQSLEVIHLNIKVALTVRFWKVSTKSSWTMSLCS